MPSLSPSHLQRPKPPAFSRILFRLALFLALVGMGSAGCKLVRMGSDRLIVPSRYELGADLRRVVGDPASWGLKIRPFATKTTDEVMLPGYIVTAAGGGGLDSMKSQLAASGIQSAKFCGTVVLLHGINSRKEHMLGISRWLVAAGYQCIIYDSRGHGEAEPNYATFGAREVADLAAVLRNAAKVTGRSLGPVGIYGYSMGGAIALQSLPEHPEIKAAVTAATFADLQNVLYHQAGTRYRGALRPLMPAVRWQVESKAGFDPFSIRPVDALNKVSTPVFIIHGEMDAAVPVSHSERLQEACAPGQAQCRIIKEAAHGNVISKGGSELMVEMVKFYRKHLH